MNTPLSAMEAVPLVGATATNMATFWPGSGSLTVTVPVAGTVAVVAAVASPTDGGWFGAARTSTVIVPFAGLLTTAGGPASPRSFAAMSTFTATPSVVVAVSSVGSGAIVM